MVEVISKICSSCCYSAEECETSTEGGSDRELEMFAMMLRHGMLDPDQEIRARELIAEKERKANKLELKINYDKREHMFNIKNARKNCSKNKTILGCAKLF